MWNQIKEFCLLVQRSAQEQFTRLENKKDRRYAQIVTTLLGGMAGASLLGQIYCIIIFLQTWGWQGDWPLRARAIFVYTLLGSAQGLWLGLVTAAAWGLALQHRKRTAGWVCWTNSLVYSLGAVILFSHYMPVGNWFVMMLQFCHLPLAWAAGLLIASIRLLSDS